MRFTSEGEIGLPAPQRLQTKFEEVAGYPSWMTGAASAGSTVTMLDPATTPGGVSMVIPATAGANRLVNGPLIDLSLYRAVRLRCVFKTHASVGTLAMGFTAPDGLYGAGLHRAQTSQNMTIRRTNSVSGTTYVNTWMTPLNTWRTFDMSVLLDCETRDIFMMQGDQVNDVWRNSAFSLGPVNPRFSIRNDSGTNEITTTLRSMTIDRWAY